MREIEFRAWDKKESEFIDDVFIGGDGWHFQQSIDDHNENVEIVQYTGLKDKNGVKIFEGDIVDFYPGEGNGDRWFFIIKIENMTVGAIGHNKEVHNEEDMVFSSLWDSECLEMRETSSFNVIGNIYENPELLGDKSE